jgi:hypothetical protein
MRAFTCPVCRVLVTFESVECLSSGTALAFDWQQRDFVELRDGAGCANRELIACNGLAGPTGLCASCILTRTRPNDNDPDGLEKFAVAEAAKRRLLFELLEIGLPVDDFRRQAGGLCFDMLSGSMGPVTTGHADGVITLDLDEADPAHRERMRTDLDEPYRTVLGHLRHEIAHYYQPLLAPEGSPELDRCRELFGDDRDDYSEAMDRYYADGAPGDWLQSFVSAYATMHPWEDWAETFAHYLHIRDVLQTATHYGVTVSGPSVAAADEAPLYSYPATAATDFQSMMDAWLPLTYALNAVNRSIGNNDLYPFVLSPPVMDKLAFIDEIVRRGGSGRVDDGGAR